MEQSVLVYISPNNVCFYYEGWRNGKKGAIAQLKHGEFHFVEQVKNGSFIDDVYPNQPEKNPVVAVGITAYWLQYKRNTNPWLKALTKYENNYIPQDIREQFEEYTVMRFEEFHEIHRDDIRTLHWNWEEEFLTRYIITHEKMLNKQSEKLFDYISDDDIKIIRLLMDEYIAFLQSASSKCNCSEQAENNKFTIVKRPVGRPSALPFENYLLPDAPSNLMKVLEEVLKDLTGKKAFTIILAITGVYINEPETTSVCNRFASVKQTSYDDAKNRHKGINKYTGNPSQIPQSELDNVLTDIKKRLNLLDNKNTQDNASK